MQNGGLFCDSSSGALIGDDDAGSVPATPDILKCEATVAKAVTKLIGAGAKCHATMDKLFFFKGIDFNEETCEETDPVRFRGALDKFNTVRDKLLAKGICPPCLTAQPWTRSRQTLCRSSTPRTATSTPATWPPEVIGGRAERRSLRPARRSGQRERDAGLVLLRQRLRVTSRTGGRARRTVPTSVRGSLHGRVRQTFASLPFAKRNVTVSASACICPPRFRDVSNR